MSLRSGKGGLPPFETPSPQLSLHKVAFKLGAYWGDPKPP
ncbi:hypothetical protein ENHYD8BJ_100015 [Enhydrobacter sp. 8BJ]|nr:hypothetical protein ENHYD8BJ_100015 [Enhydrobacter sp. 8BJ]